MTDRPPTLGALALAACTLATFATVLACAPPPDPNAIAACPPPPEASVLAGIANGSEAALGDPAKGAPLFAAECARCHAPRLIERDSRLFHGYPRLDCESVAASDARYLTVAIAAGGPAIGRDKAMKPFAGVLTAAQIADLVAYLKAPAP